TKKNRGDRNGDIIFSYLISMMDDLTEKMMRIKPSSVSSSSSSTSTMLSSSLQQCQNFNTTQQQQQQQQQQLRPMELQNTIALIAFIPLQLNYHIVNINKLSIGNRKQLMSYHSLAATISSLWYVGFGRVVVVSLDADGSEYTRGACEVLKISSNISSSSSSNGDKIKVVVNININSSSSSSNNNSDDVTTNSTIATI
ncbi:MAG: hypothetical protein ACI8RD_009805, partial [Bacillariaceae sp.]